MTIDLLLAIAHHLLVFSLAAVIAAEAVLVASEPSHDALRRLASIDRSYGLVAGLVILVGAGRVVFGLKGWEFYVYNWVFWAKMAAFAGVGLLSAVPTMRFIGWTRAAAGNPDYRVPADELARVRRLVRWEIAVFALIPVLAAAMARGFGL
jgi:putative membrane protein